jgi:imidazolonepropionase-like amidohydrolase
MILVTAQPPRIERLPGADRRSSSCGVRLILLLNLLGTLTWSQPLVIRGVTVIDGTDHAPRPDMTVMIVGDRIAAVSPSKNTKIPTNARVVDGSGKFLIPGLWDMHAHGASDVRAPWSHLLFLANGVVGVRDMAGPPDAHAWRLGHTSSDNRSVSVYLGSPIVDGPSPVWADSIIAANEAQGREVVDQQQQRGADFIKIYDRLPRDVYFAIADEAHKRGIPFEGHVPESVTVAEASNAGQKSIEHLTFVAEACSREEAPILAEQRSVNEVFRSPSATMEEKVAAGKRWIRMEARKHETYDEAAAQSLFARFVRNGTWLCPTLTLIRGQMDEPLPLDDPRLNYLSKAVRAFWDAGYHKHLPAAARDPLIASAKVDFEDSLKIVGRMHRAGVNILAGTDTMNPQCFPGFGLHDELALLVDAGLSPLAALQSATRNAARFMGTLEVLGTIETGKKADLVLLNKDPLADIHNTRSIEAVVVNGQLMPRATLEEMLAEAQALASRPDAGGPGKRN